MNYCVKYSEVQVQPEWTEKPLCLWETTTMMIPQYDLKNLLSYKYEGKH